MTDIRQQLITAYRQYTGCSEIEAERAVAATEVAAIERATAHLMRTADEVGGMEIRFQKRIRELLGVVKRLRAEADGRKAYAEDLKAHISNQAHHMDRLIAMYERGWEEHMRFHLLHDDGTCETLPCADWCYACKLDRLRADTEDWKKWESAARGACMRLAELTGYPAVLPLLQAGRYDEAITAIQQSNN
jgi:hypothetical protein